MSVLVWIILATVVNGLAAFVGIFSLLIKEKFLKKILLLLVAFSAGGLLSGGFLHLLAESLEMLEAEVAFLITLSGFSLFFIIERFLHWHHCHDDSCKVHSFTYMILIGDGIHNFIDGLIIAASFIISIPFGVMTTILILGHEIPQELGDFGALVHGGFEKKKALLFNFGSQLTAVAGGILGFFLGGEAWFTPILLPFAAGGFFYIAASDLIPELHKESDIKKSMLYFIFFLLGITFMVTTKYLLGG